MTRVLVTGATGFLGRHVVRRLEQRGATVTVLSRTRDGDLADPAVALSLLSPWRWDAAVNLAGPVTGGAEDLRSGIDVVAAHVRIALHLQRHAARVARIVHASSMTVYGPPDRLPIAEDHPRRPQHLYALGKVLAEDILDGAAILRLPGLFSSERRGGALYHFCRAARAGETLRVTTPAPTPWDILHVDDAADAIVRALDAPVTGPMNISYGEPVELAAIARWIATHAGAGSAVECAVAHPVFQMDITRARRELAWSPPPLATRLAELYADFAKNAPIESTT